MQNPKEQAPGPQGNGPLEREQGPGRIDEQHGIPPGSRRPAEESSLDELGRSGAVRTLAGQHEAHAHPVGDKIHPDPVDGYMRAGGQPAVPQPEHGEDKGGPKPYFDKNEEAFFTQEKCLYFNIGILMPCRLAAAMACS